MKMITKAQERISLAVIDDRYTGVKFCGELLRTMKQVAIVMIDRNIMIPAGQVTLQNSC